MKKLLLFPILAALFSIPAFPAQPTCVTGTLQSYIALDPQGGCTISGYAFENWAYTQTGVSIPATDILVTPILSATSPGFSFSVASGQNWQLGVGQSYTGTIYITQQSVPGTTTIFSGSTLSLSGGGVNTGELIVTGTGCLAGFLPGCSQQLGTTPYVTEVTTSPGSSVLTFAGNTQSSQLSVNIALQGPATGALKTGFSTMELLYTLSPGI